MEPITKTIDESIFPAGAQVSLLKGKEIIEQGYITDREGNRIQETIDYFFIISSLCIIPIIHKPIRTSSNENHINILTDSDSGTNKTKKPASKKVTIKKKN